MKYIVVHIYVKDGTERQTVYSSKEKAKEFAEDLNLLTNDKAKAHVIEISE